MRCSSSDAAPSGAPVTDAELRDAIKEIAYLEGDFVLRSGKRSKYYLDKYRFETQPQLLRALGVRIASVVADAEPDAVRLAGPELAAVPLAAAAALESGLPFLLVRKAAKDYSTSKRIEGVFEPGERICLVEDVVTTGGALLAAVEALREAGLTCETAICVVDREEGGEEELARQGIGLRRLFTAAEILAAGKSAANPHG